MTMPSPSYGRDRRPSRQPRRECRELGVVVALLATTACTDALGPNRGDPSRYTFAASVVFACGHWSPSVPTDSLGLFDVVGGRKSETEKEADAARRLVNAVLEARGTIVHKYNVLVVRAILPIDAVKRLDANAAYGVVNATDFDVRVFVGFRAGVAQDVITSNGGRVLQEYASIRSLHAVLPDRAIPSVRADMRVRYVEHALGVGCFALN